MSTKVRMRCAHCGKSFKSSTKQTLCPECEAKDRRARAAAKAAPAKSVATVPAPVRQPKIVGPGAGILVPGLARPSTTPATQLPPTAQTAAQTAAQVARDHLELPTPEEQHHAEHLGLGKSAGKGGQPGGDRQRKPKQQPPREPKPHREPTPPFKLTDELRARIEARYLELAQPVEFDGIRTRIATELSIPKSVVKKAVLELRQHMQMPSWWELQSYKGSSQDLERIREAYAGYLPVPPVGIHKVIAEELGLEPLTAYQGIRRIRAEMHLPQYNPPELHQDMHDRRGTSGAVPEAAQIAVTSEEGDTADTTDGKASQSTAEVTSTPGEAR